MGLYLVDCPVCKKAHHWFSGNVDQRCPECAEAYVKIQMNAPAWCNHCQRTTNTTEWDCTDCGLSKPYSEPK